MPNFNRRNSFPRPSNFSFWLTPCWTFAGNKAKVEFNFDDYTTKDQVLAAVDKIRYLRENTNMTGGLKVARLEVFSGNYVRRRDVESLIILITDGVPTHDADKLDEEVAAVKGRGIRIIGLGVTSKVKVAFMMFFYRNLLTILWLTMLTKY